jgi:hypothetical protein
MSAPPSKRAPRRSSSKEDSHTLQGPSPSQSHIANYPDTLDEHIERALQQPHLVDYVDTVKAIFKAAAWMDIQSFSDPNNKLDPITVLEKPWLYYIKEKSLLPGLVMQTDADTSSKLLGKVFTASTRIAAVLMILPATSNDLCELLENGSPAITMMCFAHNTMLN